MSSKVVQQSVCDTLPVARLAAPELVGSTEQTDKFRSPSPPIPYDVRPTSDKTLTTIPAETRKLCVRHQRMADEGISQKLQQSLDALPLDEREEVSSIWSKFASSSHPRRSLILQGVLTMCCFSQLSLISEQLSNLIRIDPFTVFPRELSLKVLTYLDATSLCRAAQVSRLWRDFADDDILWRGICQQHIGQKCVKCGWGLPVLERRRTIRSPTPSTAPGSPRQSDQADDQPRPPKRRKVAGDSFTVVRPPHFQHADSDHSVPSANSLVDDPSTSQAARRLTRPWKEVYSERLTVEKNWRNGKYSMRTLTGHTNGVMCLQFSESLAHPSFPILISGSYDCTARVWNLESGEEVACLRGHTSTIRCLQFDEAKLITGSMDCTMRVWNWRTGKCISTLSGHSAGVVSLNFDSDVLASGSVDSSIKIWNFKSAAAFTLRGHSDWVNAVHLWDSDAITTPSDPTPDGPIKAGKMLFSASDDGTIRLWDLARRACTRVFSGHVAQVQSMKLLFADSGCGTKDRAAGSPDEAAALSERPTAEKRVPVLISGSLDNTVKVWDVEKGSLVKTLFGHIEGVWGVASDRLRLVSGSHDRTIKVWSRDDGTCSQTLVGHRGAVNCVALGEDKIISGSDDGDIKIWSFSDY